MSNAITSTVHPVCRVCREEDDLSAVIGKANLITLNREQILVAEMDGVICGMLIFWDGGHGMVLCDHLVVTQDGMTAGAGAALILELNRYCQRHGKTKMQFQTYEIDLAYLAKRRGAYITAPMFNCIYDVTDVDGAKHG